MSQNPNELLVSTDMKKIEQYLDVQQTTNSNSSSSTSQKSPKSAVRSTPKASTQDPFDAGVPGSFDSYRSQLQGWSPAASSNTHNIDESMNALSLGPPAASSEVESIDTNTKEKKKKDKKVNQPPPNIQPKKKLTKKERRELQEAQRAAKQAGLKHTNTQTKSNQKSPSTQPQSVKTPKSTLESEPSSRGGIPLQYDDAKRVARRSKTSIVQLTQAQKRVELFSHLPQYERENSLSLNVGFSENEIHPSILSLGLKYANGTIVGGNARCVAMLNAFKQFIQDYSTPPNKVLNRDLDKKLRPLIQFLIDCRPHSISMGNAIRYVRNIIATVPPEYSDEKAKELICERIDAFIEERIQIADKVIQKTTVSKIVDGDVILTYARCHVLECIFKEAYNTGTKFRVIVVDSHPMYEGKHLVQSLSEHGISCTYILINALGYIMQEVSKVFLGASAFMSNGVAIGRVGTANVAMAAHECRIPVLFCCETYKFSDRVQLDSITQNELGNPDKMVKINEEGENNPLDDWRDIPSLKVLNLIYDVTPINYISMVVTEIGMLPPTSIPVIIREYRKESNTKTIG